MLSFEGLRAGYGKNCVLQGVDFRLTPHKVTAVVGKNGSGKSTLISCLNQEMSYTGRICFGDQNIALLPPRERAKLLGILPQNLERPRVLVEELVGFGRSPYLDLGRRFSRADREAVAKAIEDAGISGLCGRRVDELSGGERQMAYLAMVLAQNTRVVALDEPTTFLDIEREAAFLRKLEELKTRHKKTVLVILHNLSQAVQFADRIAVLQDGKIQFEGSREECLKTEAMERAFRVRRYEAEGRIFFAGQ